MYLKITKSFYKKRQKKISKESCN